MKNKDCNWCYIYRSNKSIKCEECGKKLRPTVDEAMNYFADRKADDQQVNVEKKERGDEPGALALVSEWDEAATVLTVAIDEAKGTGHEVNIPKWKAARHILQQCTQQLREMIPDHNQLPMTADTITVASLNDLAAILEVATETVWRMHTEAVAGTISPAEAAEIINETIQTINKAAQ